MKCIQIVRLGQIRWSVSRRSTLWKPSCARQSLDFVLEFMKANRRPCFSIGHMVCPSREYTSIGLRFVERTLCENPRVGLSWF